MTIEKAKKIILDHRLLFASMPDEVLEALDFLMSYQILEDIKSEIQKKYGDTGWVDDYIDALFELIDKYKADRSVEDGNID